jgi:dTDP-4-amino-4,6-dideoxygalactose transaminase
MQNISFTVSHQFWNRLPGGRKGAVLALDGILVVVAMWAAFALRHNEFWPSGIGLEGDPSGIERVWWLFLAAPLSAVLIFRWLGLYDKRPHFNIALFNEICLATGLEALVLMWMAAVVVRLDGIPRSVFAIYWLMSLGLLLASRLAWARLSPAHVRISAWPQPIMIYGAGPAGAELARSIQKDGRYVVKAFVDDECRLHQGARQDLKVYSFNELPKLIDQYGVTQVWLAIPAASEGRRQEVKEFLEQFPIEVKIDAKSRSLPSWPTFAPEEINAVRAVLDTGKVNYWTGQQCREFEQAFANCCGAKYAVAVANGTVALESALRAIGVRSGDEVVVTPRTFIASASAVVMCDARPIFADVDPVSQNITADSISAVLSPRTKAIITVHLAGWPCDMEPILDLAAEKGLKVIEDCAQAHGAVYKGRPVGSLGDVAAFSFCQDKIMTTGGEGGMVTTNDPDIWEKAWSFKDHGKSYDSVYHRSHPQGFRWLHESFGTNWRMTEMQAAIGLVQLSKLPYWHKRRRENARLLTERFKNIPALRIVEPPDYIEHAYYKYYAFVRPERLRPDWDRDRIMTAVNAEGVPCFTGSCPEIYLEKAFEAHGLGPAGRLPVARELGETSLMFLVHPTLSAADMEDTCNAVEKIFRAATREEVFAKEPGGIAAGLPARGIQSYTGL